MDQIAEGRYRWYRELNGYQWFVLVVASLGWMLDCFDQQLFMMARQPAMAELLPEGSTRAQINESASYAVSIFLMGWGIGGLIFGVMGDRLGRAKTMMITILMYSVFTGLSALSRGFWDFAVYRFLTGMGVGGEFAVGVALVAEVMPDRARPYTLAVLQALSAVGNISAALVSMGMGELVAQGRVDNLWRPMFVIGAVPALLALVVRWRLKEPERWQHAAHEDAVAKKLGSYRELFGHPTWRRHALIGLALAFSGIVGLWGIGFFVFDLVADVFRERFVDQGLSGDQLDGEIAKWRGYASMMMNIGGAMGMYGFAILAARVGRKATFAVCFIAALVSTAATFYFLEETHQVFWMIPIMGFCILSLFAGYAVYFPELFPTHLRSTGTSFCYNVGRFVAASGSALTGLLIAFYADAEATTGDDAAPMRYAGLTMCAIFLLGLLVLPFAPETKGRPLPE
ncbi:MAG TPA: MFS transporter [Lacipirellulaceae bacterium]|nr:MFS transporter [Lacipirellulaceae bacterium]